MLCSTLSWDLNTRHDLLHVFISQDAMGKYMWCASMRALFSADINLLKTKITCTQNTDPTRKDTQILVKNELSRLLSIGDKWEKISPFLSKSIMRFFFFLVCSTFNKVLIPFLFFSFLDSTTFFNQKDHFCHSVLYFFFLSEGLGKEVVVVQW